MDEARLIRLQQAAIRNRASLSGACGCFHCLAGFPADTVRAWIDDAQTALCPNCGMDAVVPASDPAELAALKRRWFKPPYEDAA